MDFNCTDPPLTVRFKAPIGTIGCGEKMHKTAAPLADAPSVAMAGADPTKGYVLMMIDPDAPSFSAPTFAPIRHWLVVNIPGTALREGNIGSGLTLSAYHRPGPPPGTGFHRYGQFVFEQPSPVIKFRPVSKSIARWNYTAFIGEYKLGKKLQSNYLLAQA